MTKFSHNCPQFRNVCVIGGGFGGLYTALKLSKLVDPRTTRIYLIDPKNRFMFLPLLYELAAGLAAIDEAAPLYENLLAGSSIKYIQGAATRIDTANKLCFISSDEDSASISYDFLVIAVGSRPRLEIIPGAREHCTPFYSLSDALVLRQRLQEIPKDRPYHIVILGGSYSGVELAMNLFKSLRHNNVTITIIDRHDHILPMSAEFNFKNAQSALTAARIAIQCNCTVSNVSSHGIQLVSSSGESEFLESDMTIFTAGTGQSQLVQSLSLQKHPPGRLLVKSTLQSIDDDCIFAIGDCCSIQDDPLPSNAQVAMQQADTLAFNLFTQLHSETSSEELDPFQYLSLGEMISLGPDNASITSLGGLVTIRGLLAALGRRLLYAARMPTYYQAAWSIAMFVASSLRRLISKMTGHDSSCNR